MHGSSGSRGLFVHLLAGAALGAVVVLMVWIFSGGRPFGEIVGTGDVSSPTPALAKQTDVQRRTAAPAGAGAQLASEPPDLGTGEGTQRGGDAIRFGKPEVKKPSRAQRRAAAKRESRSRARARKRQVVRVVAPPTGDAAEEVPVAVPSPAPTAAPAPAAAPAPQGGGAKPAKPRRPTYVSGAGEG